MPYAPSDGLTAYRSAITSYIQPQRLPAAALGGVLAYIGQADRAMAVGDLPAAHQALIVGQQVMGMLVDILDWYATPSLAEQLSLLYRYVMQEMGQANLDKDRSRLAALIPVVALLHEGWEGAAVMAMESVRRVAVGGGGAR